MERVNLIINDAEYLEYLKKNQEHEIDRIYCHHDEHHFIDVSRVAYIIALEEQLDIGKEIIYASGLLHDIGRWMEYEKGGDHAIASKELADGILRKSGFTEEEIREILEAIAGHRNKEESSQLADILYRADKLSRVCTGCNARSTCKRFQNGEKPYLFY